MVGVAGFEPTASWSRTKHATICATPRSALLLYKNVGPVSSFCRGGGEIFFRAAISELSAPPSLSLRRRFLPSSDVRPPTFVVRTQHIYDARFFCRTGNTVGKGPYFVQNTAVFFCNPFWLCRTNGLAKPFFDNLCYINNYACYRIDMVL